MKVIFTGLHFEILEDNNITLLRVTMGDKSDYVGGTARQADGTVQVFYPKRGTVEVVANEAEAQMALVDLAHDTLDAYYNE